MQIVSRGDDLHEVSKPFFLGKVRKILLICHLLNKPREKLRLIVNIPVGSSLCATSTIRSLLLGFLSLLKKQKTGIVSLQKKKINP